jgi:DNA invertase Pin-like site-specific DNA recombinase
MKPEEYREEHRRRILEGRQRTGKRGGRPRKEINVPVVLQRLNQGLSKTEIAAGQHCSVTTLDRRMEEAGIVKKGEWMIQEREDARGVGTVDVEEERKKEERE